MRLLTRRRGIALTAAAIVTALAVASGGSAVSISNTPLISNLNKVQRKLLSGFASFELRHASTNGEAATRQRASRFSPISNPTAADCPTHQGNNVKVNQNCLNITDPDLQGRAQAENETTMSVDPKTGRQVAAYNDYRRGDGTCGPSYSTGGTRWKDSTLPNNFVRGAAFGGVARDYFQASGDPSSTWDNTGNAYFACQMFQRGPGTTNNPDQSSAIYVFRSTGTGGASWNFPGRPVIGINRDSKEKNGCTATGFSAFGNPTYTGVRTAGACNNKILISVSKDRGATFTGTATDPRKLPVVPQQAVREGRDHRSLRYQPLGVELAAHVRDGAGDEFVAAGPDAVPGYAGQQLVVRRPHGAGCPRQHGLPGVDGHP